MLESKTPVIKRIEKVFNALKESKLSEQSLPRITTKLHPDLKMIGQFFQCSPEESLFLSLIFGLKVVSSNVYYNDLIHYLDCNPFFIVSREALFKSLQKKRLITKDDNWGRNSVSLNITRETYNAAAADKPLQQAETGVDTVYLLLQRVDDLMNERRRETITSMELFEELAHLLEAEEELGITSQVKSMQLPVRDIALLLYLCCQFANGEDYVDLNEMLNVVFDSMSDKVSTKRELISGDAAVIKQELIAFENDFFLMGRSVKLTDKAIADLFGADTNFFERQRPFRPNHTRLTEAKSIKEKKIYLNDGEQQQIQTLENLLQDDNLKRVQQKFENAGLGKGVVVLLYGEPGTGKTETVYHLSRITQRNLLLVDIAAIRDKYVGESEKHLKALFDEYRRAVSHFERVPILLFNESDALISKRVEVSSSVDQMNNSMQNILLQELETFEGILFATSNLNVNLDKAFERRFLYKVHYQKPGLATREKIWASKLPDLCPSSISQMARNFEFTGGQIDNVVRKYLLENILSEQSLDVNQLSKLCREESLHQHGSRIGF